MDWSDTFTPSHIIPPPSIPFCPSLCTEWVPFQKSLYYNFFIFHIGSYFKMTGSFHMFVPEIYRVSGGNASDFILRSSLPAQPLFTFIFTSLVITFEGNVGDSWFIIKHRQWGHPWCGDKDSRGNDVEVCILRSQRTYVTYCRRFACMLEYFILTIYYWKAMGYMENEMPVKRDCGATRWFWADFIGWKWHLLRKAVITKRWAKEVSSFLIKFCVHWSFSTGAFEN